MDITYTYEAKPLSLNQWRTKHYMAVATVRREWREAFGWLHKENPQKFTVPVTIIVRHESKGRTTDPAACAECYKAALDGLIDGGLLPDDTGKWVRSVTFLAPEKTGRDALSLIIKKAPTNEA